jgi:hypothetical protein
MVFLDPAIKRLLASYWLDSFVTTPSNLSTSKIPILYVIQYVREVVARLHNLIYTEQPRLLYTEQPHLYWATLRAACISLVLLLSSIL